MAHVWLLLSKKHYQTLLVLQKCQEVIQEAEGEELKDNEKGDEGNCFDMFEYVLNVITDKTNLMF